MQIASDNSDDSCKSRINFMLHMHSSEEVLAFVLLETVQNSMVVGRDCTWMRAVFSYNEFLSLTLPTLLSYARQLWWKQINVMKRLWFLPRPSALLHRNTFFPQRAQRLNCPIYFQEEKRKSGLKHIFPWFFQFTKKEIAKKPFPFTNIFFFLIKLAKLNIW